MQRFVYVGRNWVNLDKVDVAKPNGSGDRWTLLDRDGHVLDDNAAGFLGLIAGHVPAQGRWEVLMPGEEGEILVEPLIAWGVRVSGSLVPITASETEGVQGDYALRDVDRPFTVYGPSAGLGGMSYEDWRLRDIGK